MARGPAPESKRGLVVTLVFFILATIGAGVAAYYGFAEQEKLREAAKAEVAKTKAATDERDYYRIGIGVLRAYVDKPAPPDSPVGREAGPGKQKIDAGGPPYNGYKDLPEMQEVFKFLGQKIGPWDAQKSVPTKTLAGLVKEKDEQIKALTNERDGFRDERDKSQAAQRQAEANLKKANDDYNAALDKAKKDAADARAEYDRKVGELTASLKKAVDDKDPEIQKHIDELIALRRSHRDLQDKYKKAEDQLSTMKAAQSDKVEESPTKLEKRGEIVRVALDGKTATINLGRSSGVTPQTTFAVHGRQPNGMPKPLSKGNVEVLAVHENTSDVLIRSIFDPSDRGDPLTGRRREITYAHRDNTDPITRGDVLVNPLWDPNKKTHIAVAGVLDFSGTGAFNIESFIRMMERQNIVLDSYIDPGDGQIKGAGITRRTDYVILGGTVSGREAGVSKDENVIKAINDNRAKVIDEAKRNGVGLISIRRFMKETGFTLPRTATVD